MEAGAISQNVSTSSSAKGSNAVKRKRAVVPKKPPNTSHLVRKYVLLLLHDKFLSNFPLNLSEHARTLTSTQLLLMSFVNIDESCTKRFKSLSCGQVIALETTPRE